MIPHNPYQFQVTEAPVWPRRVKLAVIVIMAMIPVAAAIAHKLVK